MEFSTYNIVTGIELYWLNNELTLVALLLFEVLIIELFYSSI